MRRPRRARLWHTITASVVGIALVLQLILVVVGVSVLVPEESPALPVRLVRFLSYFTVDSNILVLVTAIVLLRDPARDGAGWRVFRLMAVSGISVTAIVHWFFLRPLLDLAGWSYAADKLLHVVVPLLAVSGWALFGPRPRITWRVVWLSLIYPAVWLVYTLVSAAFTGWYPYPFLDVQVLGAGPVALACTGVTVSIVVLSAVLLLLDRRLPVAPAGRRSPR